MDEGEYRVHLGQLKSALETAQRMRDRAEKERAQALGYLAGVALEVLPGEVDRLARQGERVETWEAGRLARWLKEQLKAEVNRLSMLSRTDLADQVAQLQARLAEREREIGDLAELVRKSQGQERDVKELRRALQACEAERTIARDRVRELEGRAREAQPAAKGAPDTPAAAVALAPPDLSEWQAKPYWPHVEAILRAMGGQGACRVCDLQAAIPDLRDDSAAFRNLDRAIEWGLVAKSEVDVELRGRRPTVIRLTPGGQAVYAHLFGRDPAANLFDRLVVPHRSEEQALLALMARDVFEHYGAAVDLFPPAIPLPSGQEYRPDLAVTWEGSTLHVEVDRFRGGKRRPDKWTIYAQAAGGAFYFVVPGGQAQSKLLSELAGWTMEYKRAVVLRVCNLSAWAKTDGVPWTLTRELGQRYK